ncbi:AraC family transcriptional regulator [Paenibacillus ginsengarvi]|uniref:AraC family transcriptional regulator n=1 Tax=Paenibacillus ginsengarvi TaxID=400777 RepID=A0A3B0CN99_9BACL|nr:helix-turn-helix domain-containing protein [Paenibacillus ginsengarvi]RKN86642.1 AraC family transcriptional regulator [Paenibacillus ginsengarvi]
MTEVKPRKRLRLQTEIEVADLYTFYYFELPTHYMSGMEQYDFWVLSYIDKGEMLVNLENDERMLKQGELTLFRPGTLHRVSSSDRSAPNVMIVSFECHSPGLNGLANKTLVLTDSEKRLLSFILQEAYRSFELKTQDREIVRSPNPPFGGEQMIKNVLELLLLALARRSTPQSETEAPASIVKPVKDGGTVSDIIEFMKTRLSGQVTAEEIGKTFGIGKAQLYAAFKTKTGYGIMEYFKLLKMEEAKRLIREDKRTITEIAASLDFNNVQYFSKQFKRLTGMKPTEYAKTVHARFGRGNLDLPLTSI